MAYVGDLDAKLDTAFNAIDDDTVSNDKIFNENTWKHHLADANKDYSDLQQTGISAGNKRDDILLSFIDNLGLNLDDDEKQALLDAAIALTMEERGLDETSLNALGNTKQLIAANIIDILEAGEVGGDAVTLDIEGNDNGMYTRDEGTATGSITDDTHA